MFMVNDGTGQVLLGGLAVVASALAASSAGLTCGCTSAQSRSSTTTSTSPYSTLNGYFLAAERWAEALEKDRDEMITKIIRTMILPEVRSLSQSADPAIAPDRKPRRASRGGSRDQPWKTVRPTEIKVTETQAPSAAPMNGHTGTGRLVELVRPERAVRGHVTTPHTHRSPLTCKDALP